MRFCIMHYLPRPSSPIANPLCDASNATCANLAMHLCPVFCKLHPVDGATEKRAVGACPHARRRIPRAPAGRASRSTPAGRSGMLNGSARVTNLNPAICWLDVSVLRRPFNATQEAHPPSGNEIRAARASHEPRGRIVQRIYYEHFTSRRKLYDWLAGTFLYP